MPDLILEDGTGPNPAANTYATAHMFADFAAATLYVDAYTAATDDKRAAALLMATRQINAQVEFWGVPLTTTQPMDWPRREARTVPSGQWPYTYGPTYPEQCVMPSPKRLQDATCELALALLGYNYTADPEESGIASVNVGQTAVAVTFDSKTRRQQLPANVQSLLQPFGTFRFARANSVIRRVQ